ncbi:alpha/beta hydrolase [Kaarinaea lacus]
MIRYLLITIFILTAYGCATTPQDNNPHLKPNPKEAVVNVWYATDRGSTRKDNLKEYYGKERGEMSYGICQVAIDLDAGITPFVDNTLWQLNTEKDLSDTTELREISTIPKKEFFAQMQQQLNASGENSILLYIHGYMRSFEMATREAARLAYEISYKGIPALYSWPSRDSLMNYIADVAGVDWSVANLRQYLVDLTLNTEGATIHVVAHSLGNRALLNALVKLQEQSKEHNLTWKFGEIVLVAPDFDRATFKRDIAPVLIDSGSRITLYVSAVDIPLLASKMLSAYPRLGDGREGPTIIPGIETIDATEAVGWASGHTYYRRNFQVLSDLHHLISNHMGAAERPTLEAVESPEGIYWKLEELEPEKEEIDER